MKGMVNNMNDIYKAQCTIKVKDKYKDTFEIEANQTFIIEIYDSGAYSYGNGKGLALINTSWKDEQLFDIRYDERYNEGHPINYIKEFLADYCKRNMKYEIDKIILIEEITMQERERTLHNA